GITGELYISGDGLALGYLNNPELTAEKFIKAMSFLYKTGDYARWLPEGNIQFMGRKDQQVKIRGFRIELGEIEACLLNYPTVKEAVVLIRESNSREKYLCAYIVPVQGDVVSREKSPVPGEEIPIPQFRRHLSLLLPDYMVPSHYIHVAEIPLTPAGKVDRKALESYQMVREPNAEHVAPASEMEKIIADIWQDVLGLENVGIYDNFFDIGGHSISIINVNTRLKKEFNMDIPIAHMFRYSTISSLVEYLGQPEDRQLAPETDERINQALDTIEDATDLFADELG
ncbi:MAG: non-ribosomal peptide synthetase, partial [bacterium]|nr:non-ribosomal peptide synthetase [bacterium]